MVPSPSKRKIIEKLFFVDSMQEIVKKTYPFVNLSGNTKLANKRTE